MPKKYSIVRFTPFSSINKPQIEWDKQCEERGEWNPMMAKELSKCPIVAHGDRAILNTNR
jgi:hypothetical protein